MHNLNRRQFLRLGGLAASALLFTTRSHATTKDRLMQNENPYDVIIIGGSYAGMSAALTLARSLRAVLVIDAGQPCNLHVKHSHNFLTHDGESPAAVTQQARTQLLLYPQVQFCSDEVISAGPAGEYFTVQTASGATYAGKKLLFATGITDVLPSLPGIQECWGISVLHCPYCHGYEARNKRSAVLIQADAGFDYVMLIANLNSGLAVLTNGTHPFTEAQLNIFLRHGITVIETPLSAVTHSSGNLQAVEFTTGERLFLDVLYTRMPFRQKSPLPETLGCLTDEHGYLLTDAAGKTNVPGIYACGDNTSRNRTISNAVAMGTNAGMAVNKELTIESY